MLPHAVRLYRFIKQVVCTLSTPYAVLVIVLTSIIAWFGSASVGITSDKFGRRKAIAFGAIWGAVGAALMAGAAHVAMREYH